MSARQAGTSNDMASLRAAVTRHVLYCSGCWMYRPPTTILLAVPVRLLESGDGPGARAHDAFPLSIGCEEHTVNNIVWWVGAIVIILAILGFLGFR